MADKPANKTKRRVKNPETFRERAVKAAESPDKPSRLGRIKQVGGKATRPVGKASNAVFNRKPFTWLRRPLRIIGKILLPVYIRNSWKELRQVTWPSLRQSLRLTFAVIIFAIIFGATIAIVDYGLDKVFKNLLLK